MSVSYSRSSASLRAREGVCSLRSRTPPFGQAMGLRPFALPREARDTPFYRARRALAFAALVVFVGAAGACASDPPRPDVPPVTTVPASALAPVTASPAATAAPSRAGGVPPQWPYQDDVGVTGGKNGMVASDATLGSEVGSKILAAGGNAVDAAIATAFALAVVFPAAGNLGGGGFMVARIDGKPYALDFRETAPLSATREMYLDDAGKANDGSKMGHKASGVPGSVAGLYAAYEKLASKKKTWKELIAPAIELAEKGFAVDDGFAKSLAESKKRFEKNAATMKLFYSGPSGDAPAAGATWKNPELAKVLRRIADTKGKDFYKGETAKLIAKEMKTGGGFITEADLAAYEAKWRTPLELDYRDMHVTAMPPPSSGGVTFAMIAHLLEPYELGKKPWHGPDEIHLVAEAMRRAFAARNARLGDPDFVTNPVDELTSAAWADAQRKSIDPAKATPSGAIASTGQASGTGPHTTHFSVVDAKGNAVALTTTINWWYGSGVTVPGAGFLMNNEMDDFAAKVGTANAYGLVQGEPNAIAPKKRMLSSMTPTIVTDKSGQVRLVLGAAGGPTIITSVFQIFSNVVDHGMPIGQAAHAPRIHHQHLPDTIVVEEKSLSDDTRAALKLMGHEVAERGHLADAPAIGWESGTWYGVAEARRPGVRSAGW